MKIKLMEDPISLEERNAINKCLESGRYTQGELVEQFEREFARWNGSKYAVMVNSGSSANLAMVALLKERYNLENEDEVLVPSVTWPTMIAPLIQHGLNPVFCDVDETFNISVQSIKKMSGARTKAIFIVHLLGQPANLGEILKFCREKNMVLIEDCCEALGANFSGRKVGNFGAMGSFSFYFGHHMTTIEGGIITTNDNETHDLLKSMRSHGWVRNSLRTKLYEDEYDSLDFVFDTFGYNIKSTNINASVGLEQLKKVDNSIRIRNENHRVFNKLASSNPFLRLQKVDYAQFSSFCLPVILPSAKDRKTLLNKLPQEGIECRAILAGNILKQPLFSGRHKGKYRADDCFRADIIHNCGLYFPNHQFIKSDDINFMIMTLNKILGYRNG